MIELWPKYENGRSLQNDKLRLIRKAWASSHCFLAHLTSSGCKWLWLILQGHPLTELLLLASSASARSGESSGCSEATVASRQLVNKAPHSIMDDQNSWLCMYDNWSLLYPLHQRWPHHCGSQWPKIIAGVSEETRNWKRALTFGI